MFKCSGVALTFKTMEKEHYSRFYNIKSLLRKKSKMLLIAGLFIVVVVILCATKTSHRGELEVEMFRILIVGDSLSEFSIKPNGFTSILHESNNRRADITLRGFSGYSSEEIREYIDPILRKMDVDLTFLLIGTNDAKVDPSRGHSVEEYTANVNQIIRKIHRHSKDVCLITPPPSNNNEIAGGNDYRNAIITIAEESKLQVIDTWEFIKNEDLYDGIHFNDFGNRKMADEMQQIISNYRLSEFLPDYN